MTDEVQVQTVTTMTRGKPKVHVLEETGKFRCKGKVPDGITATTAAMGMVTCRRCRGEMRPRAVAASSDPKSTTRREQIRFAVRFAYDLQKLRIMQGNRAGPQAEESMALLDDTQRTFLAAASGRIHIIEEDAFKEVERLLRGVPVYEQWIKVQKGVGPTMGGVIVSSIDINRTVTCGQMWAAFGMAVEGATTSILVPRPLKEVEKILEPEFRQENLRYLSLHEHDHGLTRIELGDKGTPYAALVDAFGVDGFKVEKAIGTAQRRKKGEKAKFDPWLKSKALHVLGGGLLKANNATYRKVYDDYRNRKSQQVVTCMLCNGSKVWDSKPCGNCDGTGRAPWGRSDAHRHQAAVRRMVKEFLRELYVQWRTLEGLSVRVRYEEEYLGRQHHQ